jgi:hypothetical protein
MSHLNTIMQRLTEMIEDRLRTRDPFRAIVTGIDGGMVTIRRLEAATGETELRARIPGWHLAADDEVLCLPVNGKPVILGPIQRSTTVTQSLELGTSVAATTPGSVTHKIEVFDAAGDSLGFIPVYGSIS